MILFTVFCVVLVGINAKPEEEHEIQADLVQAAHDVLESMLYAKEYAHMARSSDPDEESYEEANDENNYFNWEMYSALDDGVGVTPEYFQSFMVAEMADILLEAPLSDEVESDEPVPVTNRFFCGNCFIKYKACKDVCFGLVAVSADHAIDIIPCATTCLQRLSACCVARREWSSKNKGQPGKPSGSKGKLTGIAGSAAEGSKGKLTGVAGSAGGSKGKHTGIGATVAGGNKGRLTGIAGAAAAILAQFQGSDLGGSSGKFGQGKGDHAGTDKLGQAQGALAGTGDKFGQAQGIFAGTDKLGQAQGASIAGNEGKFGQAQAVVQSGDIGNVKAVGATFGQANLFGINIGQVPNINIEGLPDKIQAIFGSVNKAKDKSTQTISDIPLATLTESTVVAAYPPIQQVVAPSAVTSVFETTTEYTVPTVHAVTTEYTVTSVHTKTSEYHATAVTSSPVVTPPVINY